MNPKNIFRGNKNNFKPQEELQNEVVIKFLRVLENLRTEELSCGEMYARLDEFVETEVKSQDLGKLTPLIREHLEMCPDCCEEYEALLTVLENTKDQ
jgi:hypothetical protein